jgi:hypothetical protein
MSTNTLSHVQVIGCRCINSGTCANNESFRLLISDGQHYMQVRQFHIFIVSLLLCVMWRCIHVYSAVCCRFTHKKKPMVRVYRRCWVIKRADWQRMAFFPPILLFTSRIFMWKMCKTRYSCKNHPDRCLRVCYLCVFLLPS